MITRTTLHAVTALAALAQLPEGAYSGAAEVADQIGAPRNYLGKLLKTLADVGLVESQKGKGGGFRLARDSRSISLYEVADPIERVSRWSGCFLGQSQCSSEVACPLHQQWGNVRDAYLQFLRETTIADLAEQLPDRSLVAT